MKFASQLNCYMVLAAMLLPYAADSAANTHCEQRETDRLRVGLVLGGGGARGAAHIGVIRELEKMRVPIDAIAGTSMGALVGGLYASGMNAAELEQLIGSIEWNEEITDTPRRNDLSFRRKEDDRQFPVRLEVGINRGEFRLPMGLVQGHSLDLKLRELTADVSHIENFDELPIPFRAVTTDIEKAESYVIDRGDLAFAMRASMSVPGAFAPVDFHDRKLVDGGVMANLPIDVARSMDVDVIIAVDVEFPLYTPDELDSALKISEQMLTILVRRETQRQIDTLCEQDILIRPELGTFASADFGGILDAIKPGAAAATGVADRLRVLGLEQESYDRHVAQRQVLPNSEAPVDFVRVLHDGRLSDATLRTRIKVQVGDSVQARDMVADANRLYGLDLYEQVSFRRVEEDGRNGVEYRALTKSWGATYLQFGASLEDDLDGSTAFNIAARLTNVGINSLGAEWRTDLQLGSDPLLFSEFYQPLAAGSSWFLAPRAGLRQFSLNRFVGDDRIASLRLTESEAGLDLGKELGNTGEIRLGVFRGAGKSRVKEGDPALSVADFDVGGILARSRFDTFDHAYFPSQGYRADLLWTESRRGLGADSDIDTFNADFAGTWSHGRNSLQLGLSYASAENGSGAFHELIPMGGFLRLSGLERGAINGTHTALAKLIAYRRMGDSAGGLFDMPFYLGVSLEAGNAWQSRADIGLDTALINGSVFAGFDTYVGPVYLAAGFGEGGDTNVYLFVGAPPR